MNDFIETKSLKPWELLSAKSEDRAEASALLQDHFFSEIAFEQSHLALELAIKSALLRRGISYPKDGSTGHDIKILSEITIEGGKSILAHIRTQDDANLRIIHNVVLSTLAWNMRFRYQEIPMEPETIEESIGYHLRLYVWIKEKFIK